MRVIKVHKGIWQVVAAIVLSFGIGMELAKAGVDEDFALGNTSYQAGDFASAMPLLRKAADAGHAQAQAVLASILDVSGADEEAVAYYRKSAAAGNLDGIYGLATMLAAGEGVKKDVQEARTLFVRAAEGGHKHSVVVIAQAYIRGELEIAGDQRYGKEALKWINLAADQGFIPALEVLEQAYRSGSYGLAVDPKNADLIRQKIDKLVGVKDTKKDRRRGERKSEPKSEPK